MKTGSVLVDVAIDQGGRFATSHPTTHAPNNVTLPYALALALALAPVLADKGYKKALLDHSDALEGLNVRQGKVTYKAVADDLGYEYVDPRVALGA